MQTPPKFTPATTPDEQTAPEPERTALGAEPAAAAPAQAKKKPANWLQREKAEHAALVEDRKRKRALPDGSRRVGRPPVSTRDALVELQYTQLTQAAPAVLKRLVEGALDKGDPYHEKCLDLVAKRLMPLEFWNSLGKQEFKSDEEGGKGPVFVINVGTAQLPGAPAIEVVPREPDDE